MDFSKLCLYMYDSIQQRFISTYAMPELFWGHNNKEKWTLPHVLTTPREAASRCTCGGMQEEGEDE